MLSTRRKRVALVAALLLVIPTIVWLFLYSLGLVAPPGKPIVAPFNMSDRIATIQVEKNDQGEYVATFSGWESEKPPLSGEEFFAELHRRNKDLPTLFRLIDVTSITGLLWVGFGGLAQLIFSARLIVQWRASEKAKSSVVPNAFWWLSLLGASMLVIYFVWRKDPVGLFGQATGWIIYVRNLWFIYGRGSDGN